MNKKHVLKKLFLHIGIPLSIIIISAYSLYALIYQELFSLHIVLLFLSFFLTFYISILWHEFGHLVAFLIQGYKIKGFFVLGLGLTQSPLKLHLDSLTVKMLGGIVIPKLKSCDNDDMFKRRLKELKTGLIFGPIFSYILPFVFIIIYFFIQWPFIYMMIWFSLGILFVIHRSFFVSFSGLFGDLKAFHILKTKHDILLLLYHQHMMLYEIDTNTKAYIYKKAIQTWNIKQSFDMASDMHLMMMVIDSVRFGYLNHNQDLQWGFKELSNHSYFKRNEYQQLLVYHIWIELYLEHHENAAYYYAYMLKHANKYAEALDLLHIFVYHEPISNTLFEQFLSDLSIYHYIVDKKIYKNYFISRLQIADVCEI
jgi:hypothetical protein